MTNFSWLLLLGFLTFSLSWANNAQELISDPVSYDVLVFEHFEKGKTYFIRKGGRIKYRLYNNPKTTYKGELQKVNRESMIIDGREIPFKDCSLIAGRVRSPKEFQGAILLGMGAGVIPLSAALLGVNTIAGPIVIVGGVVVLTVGIIRSMSARKFKMSKGWAAYGGQLQFDRSYQKQ